MADEATMAPMGGHSSETNITSTAPMGGQHQGMSVGQMAVWIVVAIVVAAVLAAIWATHNRAGEAYHVGMRNFDAVAYFNGQLNEKVNEIRRKTDDIDTGFLNAQLKAYEFPKPAATGLFPLRQRAYGFGGNNVGNTTTSSNAFDGPVGSFGEAAGNY